VTPTVATVGHGATSLWYLTRATGLVALVLLTGSVVIGIVSSLGWATERWPRFSFQVVHRNVSLLSLVLIVVHVITTVADGYVPIGFADAVIPFATPYRTIWVGLGACAFDLFLAVAITSGLRRRIGVRAWRAVHWLAYACWPLALFHSLGSGTDGRLPGTQLIYLACVVAVVAALAWRIAAARSASAGMRLSAAIGGAAVVTLATVFAVLGPLQPGWSRRAGTSSALLGQLASQQTASATAPNTSSNPPPSTTPQAPFTSSFSGSYSVVGPDRNGNERLVFSAHLQPAGTPLTVSLVGTPVDNGVAMTSGLVTLGTLNGPVTTLDGSDVRASVSGAGHSEHLSIHLTIDQVSHAVSGSVSGVAP
jgi:sulfoxide reductase heme-binding subunit YedZ